MSALGQKTNPFGLGSECAGVCMWVGGGGMVGGQG